MPIVNSYTQSLIKGLLCILRAGLSLKRLGAAAHKFLFVAQKPQGVSRGDLFVCLFVRGLWKPWKRRLTRNLLVFGQQPGCVVYWFGLKSPASTHWQGQRHSSPCDCRPLHRKWVAMDLPATGQAAACETRAVRWYCKLVVLLLGNWIFPGSQSRAWVPILVQAGLDSACLQAQYTKQPSCSPLAWVGPACEARSHLRNTSRARTY